MQKSVQDIVKHGNKLFSDRATLMSVWQEISDNFYPERADFTVTRNLGRDFAAHLMTSYPVLTRRELGSNLSSMLRPAGQEWFHMTVGDDDDLEGDDKGWLQEATKRQYRMMIDRNTQFVRATKEGDNDFVTFGQCVLSVEWNWQYQHLLYRAWHLRDVVWCESTRGQIDTVHRNWNATGVDIKGYFNRPGDKVHDQMQERIRNDAYGKFKVRHVVLPADQYEDLYGDKNYRPTAPFVSLWVDVDNQHVIRQESSNTLIYVIPRWQTVSGSQYAYSPCTIAALPDARLIQAMTLVLLEAGEKAVNPPLLAYDGDAIRSDINIYAGGITFLDPDRDERQGEILRPLNRDAHDIPLGIELRQDVKAMIAQAFYLDKLNLPPVNSRQMTAFEISQRVQEYIRNASPLFEPMEMEYNGAICEQTFQVLMDVGAFGPRANIPSRLRGENVQFRFESPLYELADKQKSEIFLQGKALLAQTVDLDPGAAKIVNARQALRDSLEGIGMPAKWLHSDSEMEAEAAAEAKQAQVMQTLQTMGAGAQVAEQVGKAAQAVQGLGAQGDMA